MTTARDRLALAAFSLIPYVACSLGFVAFTHGSTSDFWIAMLVLICLRAFFSLIEFLGGALMWRTYGRKNLVSKNLLVLSSNRFPPRLPSEASFLEYLERVRGDQAAPFELRAAAREFEGVLRMAENNGVLLGTRMHAAADAAFEIYSPRGGLPQHASRSA